MDSSQQVEKPNDLSPSMLQTHIRKELGRVSVPLQVEELDMLSNSSVEVVHLYFFLTPFVDPDPESHPAILQRPGRPEVFLSGASEGRVLARQVD